MGLKKKFWGGGKNLQRGWEDAPLFPPPPPMHPCYTFFDLQKRTTSKFRGSTILYTNFTLQGRQKRASVIEEKQPPPPKVSPVSPVTVAVQSRATSESQATGRAGGSKEVPEMGHVARRLAMFQKS